MSATVSDGWLWGRGAADSKVGAAIFCHIAARLAAHPERLHGRLALLFDVDEHTGGFGGARTYFEGPDAPGEVAGVLIGYPGIEHVVIGGRGVYRATLHVHGISSHSGGRVSTPNALVKAADLIRALHDTAIPGESRPDFPFRESSRSQLPKAGKDSL
ncbi:M20/M25/M40 family metallo-hydrolase [Saccharothrix sp. AJ9571]|nr:M20/M25/M40 family metallo-hydrolase [Saccharothrix sp. AJ9571]